MMLIIPAIDLLGGEAVRLVQGDYARKTVYNADPAAQARLFEEMGTKYLHVVDLDGAKSGQTINLASIRKIREAISIPMQLGGGIRNAETVAMYLDDIGVNRVILGSIAVQQPDFVAEMLAKHGPERIVLGVDIKDGMVATEGWTNQGSTHYLTFINTLREMGVAYIVLTDISKDGMLTGPSWQIYEELHGIKVIVSGGVADESDIAKAHPYYGVIVGKAYYDGKVDLAKCLKTYK